MKKIALLWGITLLLSACTNLEARSAETLKRIRDEYKAFGLLDGVKGNTLPHSTVDSDGNPIATNATNFVYQQFVDEPNKEIINEQDFRALWKQPTTFSIYPTYDLHVYVRRHNEADEQKKEIYPFYGVAPVLSKNGDELPMLFITLTTESGQALTKLYPKETYDISITRRPQFVIEQYNIITVYDQDIYAGSESISGLNPLPAGYHYALIQTTTSIGEFTYQRPVAISSRSYKDLQQNPTSAKIDIIETTGPSFYSQFYTPK